MSRFRALLFFPALIAQIFPFRWTFWLRLLPVMFVMEGAFRKWIFPSLSHVLYFSKDVVIFIMICKFLHSAKDPRKLLYRDNAFHVVFLLLFTLVTLNCFNPRLSSPLIGMLGLRSWFMAAPLVYLFHQAFHSRTSLFKFLRFFVLLMIPVFAVVILQVNSEPDSFINRYSNVEEGHSTASINVDGEKVVRVTGTFSYISGISTFCLVCLTLIVPIFVFASSRSRSPTTTFLGYLSLLTMILIVALASGSRSPIFYFVVFLILRIALFTLKGSKSFSPRALAISFFVCLAIAFPFYNLVDHWFVRFEHTHDTAQRIVANPKNLVQTNAIVGYGTGRTLASINVLIDKFNLSPPGEVDIVYGDIPLMRLIVEEGILGLVLYVLLKLIILVRALQLFDSLKSRFLQELAVAALIWHTVFFLQFPGMAIQTSVIFWFFTGLIYCLPVVERNALKNLRQRDMPQARKLDGFGDSMIVDRSIITRQDR